MLPRCLLILAVFVLGREVLPAQSAARREDARMREEQLLRQTEEIANLITRLERTEQRLHKIEAELAQIRASSRYSEEAIRTLEDKVKTEREQILDEVALIVASSQKNTPAQQPSIKQPTPGGARPLSSQPVTNPGQQEGYEYVVQRGDTLSSIVRKLSAQGVKTSVPEITAANNLTDPTRIRVGQKLFIPKR